MEEKMKALQQKSEEERRSQRDNLRFDGIAEYENESWCDTEENLNDVLYQRLNIQWIVSNVTSLKGTDFFINDGYSKETESILKFNNYENRINMQSLFMVRWCG